MTNAIAKIDAVRTALTSPQMMKEFKSALPEHVSPEKFVRIAMTAINKSPTLLDCDRKSLYAACMLAAQDGLLPDGREAALVKFKDSVAYMPMVGGILKKVRNSGELQSLSANVVYSNDKFEYWVDEKGEHFKHIPVFQGDRGKMIAVYAQALTKDGGVYFELLNEADVKKVQNAARSKNIWTEWAGEMWKKTAIRRLAKKLPMSTDLETVVQRNDDMYDFDETKEPTEIEGEVVVKQKNQPSKLLNAISKETTQKPQQPVQEPIQEADVPI
jgi:recombination protein RecT